MTAKDASFELWNDFTEYGYVYTEKFFWLGHTMLQTAAMSDEDVIESVGQELNMHLQLVQHANALPRIEMIDYRNYN